MFDDEDDLPLPDQFLSQLDLIESQAFATLNNEVPASKNENLDTSNAHVLAELNNLRQTVDDYMRQIERLQDHEMSLQGEATMLRQRLDLKQKEADATRMEMFKSVDQLNQTHKRKVEDMEQQIRSLRSQLQFADHELQQTRTPRVSLDTSATVTFSQQSKSGKCKPQIFQENKTPASNFSVREVPRKGFVSADTPGLVKEESVTVQKSVIPDDNSNDGWLSKIPEGNFHRKWFLPGDDSFRIGPYCTSNPACVVCCGGRKTVSVTCPVSKRSFLCDLSSSATPKSLIRVIEHVKAVVRTNESGSKGCIEDIVALFDVITKILSFHDRSVSFDDAIDEERLEGIVIILEHLCSFIEETNVSKFLLSKPSLHCAGLRLVGTMFVKVPSATPSTKTTEEVSATIVSRSSSLNNRFRAVLSRTFERCLPTLLTPSAFDQLPSQSDLAINKMGDSSPVTFGKVFECAMTALASSSYLFNVIDLRSYLSDCPLMSVASALQHWFSGFQLGFKISVANCGTCFTFVQLVTRSVTLSNGSIDRFLIHPCHCQPVVIGVLAQIGLASLRTDTDNCCQKFSSENREVINSLVLDSVLNLLLLIESQQPLKSSNHQPVFYLFLAKLAEVTLWNNTGDSEQRFTEAMRASVRQLLQLHDVLCS